VIIVTQLLNPGGSSEVAVLAPTLLGLLAGLTVAQDLSYDGSALWLHISTGLRGTEDRLGRALSSCTIYVPITVVLLAAAVVATGRWDLLAPVGGVTFGLLLIGLGVGSVVGTLWQWPAPPPGANPFQRGNSGGLPALLSVFVTMFGTFILGLPTIALLVWSFFTPWVGYLTIPVGLLCGLVVLRLGVTQGGRRLDRRWPEVMAAVSERAA
jgi:ABC-2 type transport system permease protein